VQNVRVARNGFVDDRINGLEANNDDGNINELNLHVNEMFVWVPRLKKIGKKLEWYRYSRRTCRFEQYLKCTEKSVHRNLAYVYVNIVRM
jgi:hypothetical protein